MSFKYGDLVVRCHQCGDEQLIETLVTGGRAIYFLNADESNLILRCDKCKVSMEMIMVPTPGVEDELKEEENEELPKEITEEETV